MVLRVKLSSPLAKWGWPIVFTWVFILNGNIFTASKLALVSWLKSIVLGVESRLLRRLAKKKNGVKSVKSSSKTASVDWFEGVKSSQSITSAATNSEGQDLIEYTGPTVYQEGHELSMPYPPIVDTTEGIAAFENLYNLGVFRDCKGLLLNLGGGAYDSGPKWLEKRVPTVKVLTADPFCRSPEHNRGVQDMVESAKDGVEIVVSISVLNVIKEIENRLAHLKLAHSVLRDGGVLYAKVWAGLWPSRGTGASEEDPSRNSYQGHKWAIDYLAEVQAIFGPQNCFVDSQNDMIVAVKRKQVDFHEADMSFSVRIV